MRERRRQDGDGPGSALVFAGFLLLAAPSILWSAFLALTGTLTAIVFLPPWVASFLDATSIAPIPNDTETTFGHAMIDKIVGLLGILFLGPLGLFALAQLFVLLSLRMIAGRAGLRNARRPVARCLGAGFVPLLALLAISIRSFLVPDAPYPLGDERLTIRWAIMSGWPMLPLLVLLAAETWSQPRPQDTRADSPDDDLA